MRAPSKRAQELVDLAKSMGFEAELTRNCHMKLTRPGCKPVFTSSSPGDVRALHNLKSHIRKSLNGHL